MVPCWNKIILGRSSDGGGSGLKFFKIILFWHGTTALRRPMHFIQYCRKTCHAGSTDQWVSAGLTDSLLAVVAALWHFSETWKCHSISSVHTFVLINWNHRHHIYHRLEEATLHLLWRSWGFSGIRPHTRIYPDETWNISERPRCALTQENAGSHPRNSPKGTKTFCFLSPMQSGLSATYPAPISAIFEIKDANRCPHAYTDEKFTNFCAGVF